MFHKRYIILSVLAVFSSTFFPTSSGAQQGWSRAHVIKHQNKEATINSVYFDGDDVWIVGAEGLIARSFDDGRTFNQVDLSVDSGLNDVVIRKDRIWIVGDSGSIMRSTDHGTSFVRQSYNSHRRTTQTGKGSIDLYSVQFADKEKGYIVGDEGLILHTSDGGLSWSEQRSNTDAQLFHLAVREDKGWIVGTGGIILHTDDAGRNWYKQYSGVPEDLNRVYAVSDRILIVTGDKGTLLRTENGGATWEKVRLTMTAPLFGASFIDRRTGWVVGYNGRILRTFDAGRTWVEQVSNTSTDLFAVSFHKNRGYAIGRDGLVMSYFEQR